MLRWVLGANEISAAAIRFQSHLATAKRDPKTKWLELDRTPGRASKNLRETSRRDGAVSRRLNFAARSERTKSYADAIINPESSLVIISVNDCTWWHLNWRID